MLDAVLALNETDTQVFDFAAQAAPPADSPAGHILVPDAHLLFNGEFQRVGTNDLKIVGDDGKSFFIRDYFAADERSHLISPEGATLSPNVVAALAGPLAPGQSAQAGAPQASQPVIGRVDALSGSCTVIRNGVSVALNAGDTVRKGDVVQTAGGSAVAIVFADGSTFSLNANARMVLDEFVYNAGGTGNSALISLVQGTFSFVAGQVAKTGDMRVDTPVATMGIRGTAVLVEISANDGQTRFSVMTEPDGTTGSFNLYDKATGTLIGTVNNSQIGWLVTPAGPLQVVAQQVQKTPQQLQQELGIVQQIFSIFNQNQQNPFVPDQQQDPNRRGDNPNDPNPQTAHGSGGGSGSSTGSTPSSTSPLTPIQQNLPGGQTAVTVTPVNNPDPTVPVPPGPTPDVPLPTGTTVVETGSLNLIDFSGFTSGQTINGTTIADQIIGSDFGDTIDADTGNDFVYAGGGNDQITAGHGGGNDYYDGGSGHDKITFNSAHGMTFTLNATNEQSTAEGATTGTDVLINIEEIVASPGDDVFVLNKASNWTLDGGAGTDTVKLASGVNLRDDGSSAEIKNIEVIDLTASGGNIVDLDLETVKSATNQTIEVRGNSQDLVNFLNNDRANGHWELAGDQDRNGFNKYIFVPNDDSVVDEYPTVYLQDGIQTGGDVVQHDVIENVQAWVNTEDGFALTSETLYTDLANSDVAGESPNGDFITLTVGDRTYTLYGEDLGLDDEGGVFGTVTGFEITGPDGPQDSLASAHGFNFSLESLFDALELARTTGDISGLDAIFENVSYDTSGGGGDDSLVGGAFRDVLEGGNGNDILDGAGGRDTLDGGAGNDELTGGTGNDVFIYNSGNDTITDFTSGSDKIDLTALQYIHSIADLLPFAHYDAETGDTTIDFGNGHSLVLEGVDLDDLSNGDFIFYQPPHLVEEGADEAGTATSTTAYKVLDSDGEPAAFNPDGWSTASQDAIEYNGHYYKFIPGNISWTEARAAALAMGGYLANITSKPENVFVHSLKDSAGAWIGASDSGAEGHWLWADGPDGGRPVGHSDDYGWWGTEPNGGTAENYAFIDHNGAWTDVPANYNSVGGYVVEFNGQGYTKTGTYGSVVYNAETGELTYTLNNGASGVQALADGETVFDTFELKFIDANGQTITRTATFTIEGSNDAPVITVAEGDSSNACLTETDAGLTKSGTLTATDVDHNAQLTAALVSGDFDADGPLGGLTPAQLHDFMSVSIDGNGKVHWTFNSGSTAFDYLGEGESLILHYTIRVSDGSSYSDQIVNITINGTNDAPVAEDTSVEGHAGETIQVTLSAHDDSSSAIFSLVDAELLLTKGQFSSDNFSTTLDADDLQSLLSHNSQDGLIWKTLQFRPYEAGNFDFKFTVTDHEGEQSATEGTASVHVESVGEAPIIHLGEADTLEDFGFTTLSGLSVSDSDAQPTDPYHVTITAQHGSLELSNSEFNAFDQDCSPQNMEFVNAPLDLVNQALADGVIYNTPEIDPENPVLGLIENVTLTITDSDGNSDSMNFIFSVYGESGVELAGEYGNHKDVLFSTAHDDTLTGDDGADTFVFSSETVMSGTDQPITIGSGNDTIKNFNVSEDRILIDKLPIASLQDLTISQGEGNTTIIDLGQANGTITLNGIAPDQLSSANFIFHPAIYNPYA